MALRRATQALSAQSLTGLIVPKTRKPKFDLHLKIIDLNNVPLVSGTSFVKWHLPHSTAAEHRGKTEKRMIKDHKVVYDYEKHTPVRLVIDKNGMLQESYIHFEVLQEYSSAGRGERIVLGNVKLNLAEYVEASEADGEEGVCRRYLMQDSKINSTLKISIFMRQLEGDRNFVAPPLKTAPVFGGIAGIMAGEQGEADDIGHMPSLSNKSKETGELQDMYRRVLAAYWTAQPGELMADECIEDIFAGGDGWGDREKVDPIPDYKPAAGDDSGSPSDNDPKSRQSSRRNLSAFFKRGGDKKRGSRESLGGLAKEEGERHEPPKSVRGRGSLEQQAKQMKAQAERGRHRPSYEVDEFEVRDDLRSWKLP